MVKPALPALLVALSECLKYVAINEKGGILSAYAASGFVVAWLAYTFVQTNPRFREPDSRVICRFFWQICSLAGLAVALLYPPAWHIGIGITTSATFFLVFPYFGNGEFLKAVPATNAEVDRK